ncbi:hypothetical protein Alg130_04621 [Pyrenophora tritici-repentis]|nr:hypothetical protein Alg130_04621 [Pyrenophora tritici-repentis]
MYLPHLLSLPPAIIALCAASVAADTQWPHNVPRHLKYFPEDEVHAKRSLSIKERLEHEKPIGVKKMSTDEGEMFMLDNWIFASDTQHSDVYTNVTSQAFSPLRPLARNDWLARMHVRDVLLNRQFKCPEGTNSCSSIGAPDVCCGTNSNCITVTGDSNAGDVGCCPKGQACAGSVSCEVSKGYTSCPDAPNGGCCLPGFKCQGIGCVLVGTSTAYVQPPTSSSAPTSTAVVVVPTSPSTTPEPISTSAYTCSTGWFSCPVSLGGGCCANGRTCATGASCLGGPTSTRAPDAPVRPTSGSATTTDAASASSGSVCPTGFYVCSAYYPSGCCRVGRDCQTTGSCALPTETILNTNGVVVVAPTGLGVASVTPAAGGSCPSAWYSCAADRGGNCCPNGYACGEQCTATASGQSSVATKVAPSSSSEASFVSSVSIWMMIFSAMAVAVAMIAL